MKQNRAIEQRNIRIRWDIPERIQSSRYETICPTENDISKWPEWYLAELYPLFPDGQIIASVFHIHRDEDNVPSKDDVEHLPKALARAAGRCACRGGHENVVDSDQLASRQECGHEQTHGRDQSELAQFTELHALPSSWAPGSKPSKNLVYVAPWLL